MRSVSISVTDAARNFADCVNRVRYKRTSFILHKNGVPVARILPVERRPDSPDAPDSAASGAGVAVEASGEQPGASTLSVEPAPEPVRKSFHPDIW
jgi:prevent-host-death family protein